MKKLLIGLSMALLPALTFAAYNDVSLTSTAAISINNSLGNAVTLTVSGATDAVESIVVGDTNFTVVLQSGSTLTVASAGRNLISTDAPDANETITCGTNESSIALTATAQVTISVSVSANACGVAVAAASSTTGGSGGPIAQSGGGGGSTSVTPAVPATPAVPTVTPAVPATPASISALEAQIVALRAAIASLGGTSVGSSGTGSMTFSKPISAGSKTTAVINLQKVLNSDSDTKVSSSGAGSPGKETNYFGPATKKAVQKFQVKYGIAKPGQTGYGVFGPKTRAKMTEVAKSKGL